MQVKIFGERHTATNALSGFIKLNFDVLQPYYHILGWKHRKAPKKREWAKIDYQNTLFIFTVRSPYSWLKAMHRQPYYHEQPQISKLSFKDFILHSVGDYENFIQMWNEKNQSYIDMSKEVPNSMVIWMEDFISDQNKIFNRLQKVLSPRGAFQMYDKYTGGYGEKDPQKKPNPNQLPHESEEIYRIINDELETGIIDFFDYQLVCPQRRDSSPNEISNPMSTNW